MPTHYKGSTAEKRALNTFIKLIRCAETLQSRLQPNLDAHGLTPSQFAVLEALLHLGPLSLGDLARKLLKSGGNLTLVVNNLEKSRLVSRCHKKDDRRVSHIGLTPRGQKVITTFFPKHAAVLTQEMSRLSPAELEALGELCKKLGGAPVTS